MNLLTLIPLVLYEDAEEVVECGQGCKEAGHCLCSLCWSAKEFKIESEHFKLRCCSKCMSKCIGCPAAKDLTPDEVVATILGLTMGPNYRSELLTSPCTNFNHIHAFFLHICTAYA